MAAVLRGKHALITGASGGIGAAIARRFAAEGATVSLAGRHTARLAEVLTTLPDSGTKHRSFQADVARYDEVNDLVSQAVVSKMRISTEIGNGRLTSPSRAGRRGPP